MTWTCCLLSTSPASPWPISGSRIMMMSQTFFHRHGLGRCCNRSVLKLATTPCPCLRVAAMEIPLSVTNISPLSKSSHTVNPFTVTSRLSVNKRLTICFPFTCQSSPMQWECPPLYITDPITVALMQLTPVLEFSQCSTLISGSLNILVRSILTDSRTGTFSCWCTIAGAVILTCDLHMQS